uniref:type II secretion system F family protein n=1 Tax=Agathobacter sp. TaxID=2021311 RepID=UPI004055E185
MQYILLVIGTILTVLFILQYKKGAGYETWVETLDENKFPLKDLYVVGFAWAEGKLFKFDRKIAQEMRSQAILLYGTQYAEYYANVIWAEMLTLTHLFLAFTFLASVLLYDSVMLILGGGLFLSFVIVVYCLEYMKNELSSRTEECEAQLAEVVSTMAVLVNSGMVLKEAWITISESNEGVFYDLMREAADNMKNGHSDIDSIYLFGRSTNSPEIKKFTSALIQSIERGGGDLGNFLTQQSSERWKTKRQQMLQNGEKAASKLLMPIMLIFVGIIIIVVTAAFAGALF